MLHASFVGAKPVPLKARPLSPNAKGSLCGHYFQKGRLATCVCSIYEAIVCRARVALKANSRMKLGGKREKGNGGVLFVATNRAWALLVGTFNYKNVIG